MLVTSEGAWEIANFDTVEECNKAKQEVVKSDTFCYKRDPISQEAQLDMAIDTFILFLEKFQNSIKDMESTWDESRDGIISDQALNN